MSDENRTNEVYDAATEEDKREEERHKARKERAERMREEKRRSMLMRRYGTIGVVAQRVLSSFIRASRCVAVRSS